jgi:hypothetical protein
LLEEKHKVVRLERPSTYPSTMVVAEALLVNYRTSEGDISSIVQHVEGIFQCLLSVFFNVSYHARCAIMHICGKYCFGSEEQEEQRVAGG